ncbi:hypothetical protein [Rhodoferax ferrireducens]|uniref:hypothetical protein n=1 Tax=Rhodoferax ferrireducens TaxID=192843 RepID=UPI001E5EE061|nr:hypothetical protein [Rhodoferax ferrireducens]
MHPSRPRTTTALLAALGLSLALALHAAPNAGEAANAKVVAEATGGKLKATHGQYFDLACNATLDFDAEVVDLNGDGRPEVFTSVHGSCLGGMAGVHMNLYIKGRNGRWTPQFGFPGVYSVLKTKNRGYPDIEIGGPGNCFPVWRWNGRQYALYKKCN